MLAKELSRNPLSQLLFIDDEKDFQRFIFRNLTPLDYEILVAAGWEQAKAMLKDPLVSPRIIFVEPWSDKNANGLDVLGQIRSEAADVPIVVLSGRKEPRLIVEAVKKGALEYLVKPLQTDKLQELIERLLDRDAPEVGKPVRGKNGKPAVPRLVSCNPAMEKIQETILQVADSGVPVLIHGESGVGKDIIARAIHFQSKLRSRNFVKVNCAALPAELTESELFGHTRGAFTGAVLDRPGKFEFAHGGTIFLDEIGEFSSAAQAKLLQVLQEGKFSRLGSNQEVEVEVRVIAATNRDLREAIRQKQFRADLYFRLNVVNLFVPPLRERRDEIDLLCDHFLDTLASQLKVEPKPIPQSLREAFRRYDWPGNVRELENLVKRYLVLKNPDTIRREIDARQEREVLQDVDGVVDEAMADLDSGVSLKKIAKLAAAKVERNLIANALSRTNWNRLQAAKDLNVSYKTLLTRIEEYKITP